MVGTCLGLFGHLFGHLPPAGGVATIVMAIPPQLNACREPGGLGLELWRYWTYVTSPASYRDGTTVAPYGRCRLTARETDVAVRTQGNQERWDQVKKHLKNLTLSRETLRRLNAQESGQVAGDAQGTTSLCVATLYNTCVYTCRDTCATCGCYPTTSGFMSTCIQVLF